MARNEVMEHVNCAKCPKCGHNNITGREYCEGVLADGSVCGALLPITVPQQNDQSVPKAMEDHGKKL